MWGKFNDRPDIGSQATVSITYICMGSEGLLRAVTEGLLPSQPGYEEQSALNAIVDLGIWT